MSDTTTLSDVLNAIPKNEENAQRIVCSRNGVLTYRDSVESLPQGTDLDTVTRSGDYILNASCTPIPPGENSQGCILRVDRWDTNRVYHELIGLNGRYFRHKTANGWASWKMFAASVVVGGGNYISINQLRNLAERRAA